jgi:hypothetical protein
MAEKLDRLNTPLVQAAEMGFAQVEYLIRQLDSKLGEPNQNTGKGRITVEEIRRLSQGE